MDVFPQKLTLKMHKNIAKDSIRIETTSVQMAAFNCTRLLWAKRVYQYCSTIVDILLWFDTPMECSEEDKLSMFPIRLCNARKAADWAILQTFQRFAGIVLLVVLHCNVSLPFLLVLISKARRESENLDSTTDEGASK